MPRFALHLLDDLEAFRLRELLAQTASPGSFQSSLIQRLDAMVEEAKRPRRRLSAARVARPHERSAS